MKIRDRITELRRVPASELRSNPRNWRRHPETQAKALRSVLEKVGYAGALIARETPDGLELIDGHLRAETTPDEVVPVLVVDVDEDEAALMLATLDPLAAMAVTDEQALYDLLQDVLIPDPGLAAALEEMTGQAGPDVVQGDPDDIPEPPTIPITQPGDLWVLGEHRLLCGDSSDSVAIDRLLEDTEVGCVLTDPPYGIDLDTDYTAMQGSKKLQAMRAAQGEPRRVKANAYRRVVNDAHPFDASDLAARFASVHEQFWFGANYYRRTLSDHDLDGSWLVWDKRKENLDTVIGSGFELIWSKTSHKQDVLRYLWSGFTARNQDSERAHPTEKPVALLEEILTRWASTGAVVDPFAGSGTTMIAAERTGRACFMVEIDPAYCDVIVTRWEDFTGKTAERITDAEPVEVHG